MVDAIGLHYYTFPGGRCPKFGPAVAFGEDQWMAVVFRAPQPDEIIARHAAVMDRYDPRKQVALSVDAETLLTPVPLGA